MWNLRNVTKEQREKERERERQTKKQTLNYREHTDGYQRGGGEGGLVKQVMGIKECTSCDELEVMYGIVETLYCIPETNKTLCVKKNRQKTLKQHKELFYNNLVLNEKKWLQNHVLYIIRTFKKCMGERLEGFFYLLL